MLRTSNDRLAGQAPNSGRGSPQARSALFGWLGVLVIGLLGFGLIGRTLWSARQTVAWTPVAARVTHAGPVVIGKRSSAINLRYEYVFGGRVMTGKNVWFDGYEGTTEEVRWISARARPGMQVVAYANPRRGSEAVLIRGLRPSRRNVEVLHSVLAGCWVLASLWGLLGVVEQRSLRR